MGRSYPRAVLGEGACVTALLLSVLGAGCGGSAGDGKGPDSKIPSSSAQKSVVIGGVRLGTRVPPLVERACRQAQRAVDIHVVCPGLVPEGPILKTAGLWGGFGFDPSLWLITFNNGDNGPRYLHWIMGAGTRASVSRYLLSDVINDVKGLPKKIDESEVGSRTLTTYRYPPHPAGGPNGGHTAVYVSCDDELVFASLHGSRRTTTEKLAIAFADQAGCP